MNKQFQKKLLEAYPEIRLKGDYFFFEPVDHLLGGFCAEVTRNGIYISEFIYPLFDRSTQLNLNFSQRLPYPDSFIDYDQFDKEDRPAELVRRIAPYVDDLNKKLNLSYFYGYFQQNPNLLKNEWTIKTYILLLVILGKFSEAMTLIKKTLQKPYTGVRKQITKECQELKVLLEINPEKAMQLVLNWEKEMMASLQIS
ncbi:hypothetical protein [Spartinivicinus poritis]|uniref:Uncharacterized protein n=1 Tax=Spartinivicinus poritis TaxID=2994640 RepID=A0ABT5UH46_9GAMM|nr:hypothetical protein [Spartinivicinus sp. A2-2]MDE1465712.1 hypothetical protein [Spartinivicinus sp. A2-2]